jgi:hypothetical protein
MLTLHHYFPSVHPFAAIASPPLESLDVEPFVSPEDAGFEPSEGDLAWWTAFSRALEGSNADMPRFGLSDDSVRMRWAMGKRAGVKARQIAEAKELGVALGRSIGGCEAPSGLTPWEAEAFREGLAIAEAEAREEAMERDFDRDRFEEVMAGEFNISDRDVWPMGCMS